MILMSTMKWLNYVPVRLRGTSNVTSVAEQKKFSFGPDSGSGSSYGFCQILPLKSVL